MLTISLIAASIVLPTALIFTVAKSTTLSRRITAKEIKIKEQAIIRQQLKELTHKALYSNLFHESANFRNLMIATFNPYK